MTFLKLLVHLHKRIPLSIKMLFVTLIVGFTAWGVLDQIQTRKLKTIFMRQLTERFERQAMEDRLRFDRYIKAHHYLVKLILTQKGFYDYIDKQLWSQRDMVNIRYHEEPPEWFPSPLLLRTIAKPRFALLIDKWMGIREVYQSGEYPPPASLLRLSSIIFTKSHGQGFMTDIEGKPYLLATEYLYSQLGEIRAALMLASPIDDEFLSNSMGSHPFGHIIALVTSNNDPQIVVSSNLIEIPSGVPISHLTNDYLVAGQEFFDYGEAERVINFASFVSMAEVHMLTQKVLMTDRQNRGISASVFILTFAFIMFWITHRIHRMTQRINEFSVQALGMQPHEIGKGDQINVLEDRFQQLTEEVIITRDALQRESEERLQWAKKKMELVQKERELNLLHSVTEAIGVGVIINTPEGLQPANIPMAHFTNICGGIDSFDIQNETEERTLIDKNGEKHIFHITKLHALEDNHILLVQDITERKMHTERLEHMALHDALTGIPNRILFYDRLNHAILAGHRDNKPFTVLMVDLDNFKTINDTFGHYAGDIVLKECSKRFQNVLRQSDTLARIGGDEFAILLPLSDIEDAKRIASRILKTTEQPIVVENNNIYVKTSIGITLYPLHAASADELIKSADKAMYIAKETQSGFLVAGHNPTQVNPKTAINH